MTRISTKAAQDLGLIPKTKYNNNKPEYYDKDLKQRLKFDSNKELEYYLLLKDKQKHGEIYSLDRQVKLQIQPAFKTPDGQTIKEIFYIADFTYFTQTYDENGLFLHNVFHVVDVKGCKTDVYKLKKKLLAYRGYYIEEV